MQLEHVEAERIRALGGFNSRSVPNDEYSIHLGCLSSDRSNDRLGHRWSRIARASFAHDDTDCVSARGNGVESGCNVAQAADFDVHADPRECAKTQA